jgi:SAM-dependent methyltransferase
MEPDVLHQIRSINHEFYQTFADSFAETRARLQPGIQRMIAEISGSESLLELGCGNGELASNLIDLDFKGCYLGIDLSERMLAIAGSVVGGSPNFAFIQAELGSSDLRMDIQQKASERFRPPYDQQVAFASLHHVPGDSSRRRLIQELHALAADDGKVCVSVWNFLESERLRERVLPWETVGLSEEQIEPGDYLIDWRRGGSGVRYVHHFSEAELSGLAQQAGFTVQETFYSDGETGNLGLYQVWEA